VVVAQLSTLALPGATPEISVASPPGTASATWVLPGATSLSAVSDEILVANVARRPVRVTMYELAPSGTPPPGSTGSADNGVAGSAGAGDGEPVLGSFSVPSGASVVVPIALSLADASQFALSLQASGSVVAEQVLIPHDTLRRSSSSRAARSVVAGAVSTAPGIPAAP
ncbi:MAG: hypothetical protein ACRDZ6_02065, partial [Acidimicrobiales bacterium]